MKRWALRVFLFLLLGAIVNVAVAWGLAVWSVPPAASAFVNLAGIETHKTHMRLSGSGLTPSFDDPNYLFHLDGGGAAHAPGMSYLVLNRSVMSLGSGNTPSGQNLKSEVCEIRCGWPTRSMKGMRFATNSMQTWVLRNAAAKSPMMAQAIAARAGGVPPPAPWIYRSAIELPKTFAHIKIPNDRWLPLRPIWPGFALNTIFYAAVLWGLFAAPLALRRWRRIKRGLCPRCAYDLRAMQSDVCPECGAQR